MKIRLPGAEDRNPPLPPPPPPLTRINLARSGRIKTTGARFHGSSSAKFPGIRRITFRWKIGTRGRGPQNSRPRSSAPRSDYLSDTRYESEALATEDRGTETGKIKGVTRDKNCGVDKHPLFSLASPVPVIFRRPSFVSALPPFPSPRFPSASVRKRASRVLARASQPARRACTYPWFTSFLRISTGEIRYRHFRVARISNDHSQRLQGCRKMCRRKLDPAAEHCGKLVGKGVEKSLSRKPSPA